MKLRLWSLRALAVPLLGLLGLLGACGAEATGDASSDGFGARELDLRGSDSRGSDSRGSDSRGHDDDDRARPRLKTVKLSTGVRMRYLEQGSPRGIPVVFVHGFTDSHRSFDLNLPSFPRRFHVFALDQRGHGDSSKPASGYAQTDFAADVAAFLDAVGLERASLVGHSMGSFVAQQVALDFPERVDRLVLIGSAASVSGNVAVLEFKAVVDTLTDPIDPEFVRAFQASTFFRPIPASFLDTSVEESLKVPASIWQQALDGLILEDHSARLGDISSPTLILFGEQDVFVTAADQVLLDAEIPDSELITYPGTGHGTHVELPRRVNRDIARFLR